MAISELRVAPQLTTQMIQILISELAKTTTLRMIFEVVLIFSGVTIISSGETSIILIVHRRIHRSSRRILKVRDRAVLSRNQMVNVSAFGVSDHLFENC